MGEEIHAGPDAIGRNGYDKQPVPDQSRVNAGGVAAASSGGYRRALSGST